MSLLNTIKQNIIKLAAGTDPQQVYDNKNIPEKRKGALATYKIKQVRPLRVRMEMDAYRSALQLAEDPYVHNRYRLYALYTEAMRDPEIICQVNLCESKIVCESFTLVKKDGSTAEKEASKYLKLFERPWFVTYLKYSQEADWWGHSLIEFRELALSDSGIVEQEFTNIELVPRQHVKPEWGEILVYPQELHGFSYRDKPFSDWLVEIGDKKYLGLLMSATREAIWKLLIRTDASVYSEKFGQPIVHIGTASDDDKEIDKKEEMARNLGSSGYIITDVDDKVELITSGDKGAGVDTYLKLSAYCDEMMSKLFNGQTLSSSTGKTGSYALGQVHADTLDDIIKARLKMRQFEINYKLIPFLIKHGYPLDGWEFKFTNLIKDTSKGGDAEAGSNADPGNDEDGNEAQQKVKDTDKGQSKKKALAFSTRTNINSPLERASPDGRGVSLAAGHDSFADELAKFAYDNRDDNGLLPTDIYLKMAQKMYGQFKEGFGTTYKTGENGPTGFNAYIRQNIFPFSAAKNFSQLTDMRDRLMDDKGQLKSFSAFKNDVADISEDYNVNWLNSEYNLAKNSGIMAGQWQNIEADKSVYQYLKYTTMHDDKVRPEHAALDGVTLKVGNPFWNRYYPPNGWNCRCNVEQIMEEDADPSDGNAAGDLGKSLNLPDMFQNNVGKSRLIYTPDHVYYKSSITYKRAQELQAETNYGLRPVNKILANDKLPSFSKNYFSHIQEYKDYENEFMGREENKFVKDPLGDDLKFTHKRFDHFIEQNRWEYANRLMDIINKPNEVYQYFDNGKLTKSFLKYYSEGPEEKSGGLYIFLAELNGDSFLAKTIYKWNGDLKELGKVRRGVLTLLKRTRF